MSYDTLTLLFVANAALMFLVARLTESIVSVTIMAGLNAYLLAALIQEALR